MCNEHHAPNIGKGLMNTPAQAYSWILGVLMLDNTGPNDYLQ